MAVFAIDRTVPPVKDEAGLNMEENRRNPPDSGVAFTAVAAPELIAVRVGMATCALPVGTCKNAVLVAISTGKPDVTPLEGEKSAGMGSHIQIPAILLVTLGTHGPPESLVGIHVTFGAAVVFSSPKDSRTVACLARGILMRSLQLELRLVVFEGVRGPFSGHAVAFAADDGFELFFVRLTVTLGAAVMFSSPKDSRTVARLARGILMRPLQFELRLVVFEDARLPCCE